MKKTTDLQPSSQHQSRIIFFDGLCPMCHGWVKRIIRWDKKKVFLFAPLEGDVAKRILEDAFPGFLKEDTIVLYDQGTISTLSTAALHIMRYLPSPYRLITAGWIVPRFIRDAIYRRIASQRYKFGQRYDSCPMPPVEWRDRFFR